MPKRKVKTSTNRPQDYIKILMNLNILHSPCKSEKCEVKYEHCSGCNESFPCKTAQVLSGRSVAQVNRAIDLMIDAEGEESETITIYGDQTPVESDDDE